MVKNRGIITIFIVVFLISIVFGNTVCRIVNSDTIDWSMFRHDPQHTGYQDKTGDIISPCIRWETPIDFGGRNAHCSSTAVGDIDGDGFQEVVVGSFLDRIFVFNGSTGIEKGVFNAGFNSDFMSSPALGDIDDDGTIEIVVGCLNGNIYCLFFNDVTDTVEEKWHTSTGDRIFSSPVIDDIDNDGLLDVVIGSDDYTIYALNGADGSHKYNYTTSGEVFSSPAVGDIDNDGFTDVVVGSNDYRLYVLNGTSFGVKWFYLAGNLIRSSPALGDITGDGTLEIFFGSDDGYLYALDSTGALLWRYPTLGIILSSPAPHDIDHDGEMEVVFGAYGGDSGGIVFSLDAATGAMEWEFHTLPNKVVPGPGICDIDGDGFLDVIVADHGGVNPNGNNGTLWAINGTTGLETWHICLGGDIHASSAIADIDNDGVVEIIQNPMNGNIYAIDSNCPSSEHYLEFARQVPAVTSLGLFGLMGLISLLGVITLRKRGT